jgi:hypothetical protein
MLDSQPHAQITKPMLRLVIFQRLIHHHFWRFSSSRGQSSVPTSKNAFTLSELSRFNASLIEYCSFNNERGCEFDSSIVPVTSFLQAARWSWLTEYKPRVLDIGVTPVHSRMVDYDLAVKLTSGLFRSGSGWRRPDTTVNKFAGGDFHLSFWMRLHKFDRTKENSIFLPLISRYLNLH